MTFKHARNCENYNDPIIRMINSTINLTDDCDLIISACSEVRPYKTASVSHRSKATRFSSDSISDVAASNKEHINGI